MPVVYREARTVDVRAERVAELVFDVERWPSWTDTFTSVLRSRSGPLAEGEKIRIKQPRLRATTMTVTDARPGRYFAWESGSLGLHTRAHHEVVWLADDRCEVLLTFALEGLLARPAALAAGRLIRSYVRREADNLARAAES